MKILIVEDEELKRITLEDDLKDAGYQTAAFASPVSALNVLSQESFDVAITDLRMPEIDGLEFMARAKELRPQMEIILITAYGTVDTAMKALSLGAYDYVTKPFSTEELLPALNRIRAKRAASSQEQVSPAARYGCCQMVGASRAMLEVFHQIDECLASDSTVLLTGETGTGKDIAACIIHHNSRRSKGPFVKVSCATLSKEIIESELFGHEKGAFTSASREKIGRFEYADKGTIFLDEIDDTTTELQVKLLRAIEEQVFERVGSSTPIKVDVRVIAATKVNLREQAEKGLFRKDLFYRLNVMPIYIPPLRERKDDIPLLLEHFLKNPDGTSSRIRIDPIAMDILNSYSWPGNVRELRNLVERLKNTKGEGVVTLFDLPEEIRLVSLASAEKGDSTFHDAMNRVERKLLLEAMRACGGNKSRAARALGLRLSTFRDKLAKHNLQELTF